MYRRTFGILSTFFLLAGGSSLNAETTSECDQQCLVGIMDRFVLEMTEKKATDLPISANAEVRENARLKAIKDTAWKDVRTVRSRITFADPITGNVVSRSGVEMADGRPGYISTRIKVLAGVIVDVELSSDTSDRVVASYVYDLGKWFGESLPVERRRNRSELEAIARRYFQSLSDHNPSPDDHIDSCNRFHSGRQVTNVALNTIEGGGRRTCFESLRGNPPWGPATEQRFPVIDPESGLVFGITRLLYVNGNQMYVSEIFRVVDGKIAFIDNIGLMLNPPVETLGFTH